MRHCPQSNMRPEPELMKKCCVRGAVTGFFPEFILSILHVGVEAPIAAIHGRDDSIAMPGSCAIRSGSNNGRHFFLFRGRKAAEDLARGITIPPADAEPEPGHGIGAQLGEDRLQSIVTARPPAGPHPDGLKGQIDVVNHDEGVFWCGLVPANGFPYRCPAEVHVGLGLDQHQAVRPVTDLSNFGAKAVAPAVTLKSSGQLVDYHKAEVVPGGCVLLSGIAQTYHNLHN